MGEEQTKGRSVGLETPAPRAQPFFAPRFWIGCNARGWFGLMARNRFAISPSRWHIFASLVLYSFCNSGLEMLQNALYGSSVRRKPLGAAPLFVLGHWRTGTTLLHELLVQDPQFNYPSTYQCLAPNHFLLTEAIFTRLLRRIVPAQRPMDNMKLSFDGPQEEEFAFCNMGMRSPYLTIAFPNYPPQDQEYLDLVGLAAGEKARWIAGFQKFVHTIHFRDARRIVLKSPPHTARVKTLLEMFPGAQFVHLVRDPFTVFTSTVHLWRSLYTLHGLQVPKFEGLCDHVFETYLRMHARYQQDRRLIPAQNLVELRYEELVADPVGQLEMLYQRLGLGEFSNARPGIERYLEENKNYKTNQYALSDELRAQIAARWKSIFSCYGYQTESATV